MWVRMQKYPSSKSRTPAHNAVLSLHSPTDAITVPHVGIPSVYKPLSPSRGFIYLNTIIYLIVMTIVGYDFQGYFDDDAQMIYNFIKDNWSKGDLQYKAIFFYDETKDPALFDFKTGEVAIRIYADEIISEPRGISYDSESQSRAIRIDVRCIDRETTMLCVDQIRKILAQYRLRPGNAWGTLSFASFTPVYPSFKFYHYIVSFTLRKYYNMLPNINLCGNERY